MAETTLLEHARRQVGMRRAFRAVTFMVCWQITTDDLGHEPTIEEFSDWWRESRSTSYRTQAIFREAFPGEDSPRRLLDLTSHAWLNRPAKRPSPNLLAGVPFPS